MQRQMSAFHSTWVEGRGLGAPLNVWRRKSREEAPPNSGFPRSFGACPGDAGENDAPCEGLCTVIYFVTSNLSEVVVWGRAAKPRLVCRAQTLLSPPPLQAAPLKQCFWPFVPVGVMTAKGSPRRGSQGRGPSDLLTVRHLSPAPVSSFLNQEYQVEAAGSKMTRGKAQKRIWCLGSH